MYKKVPKLLFFPFLLTVLVVTSCQREIDFIDTDPAGGYVRDSTLLIKSLTYLADLGSSVPDSIVENYSYDSVNRKTTITWNDPSGNLTIDGTVAELSYDDLWLLTHVTYVYPTGYSIQASDYTAIDIVYDAQKVLQKITIKYGDGTITTRNYVKTMLSSGNYQLSWDETDPGLPGGRLLRRAVFNAGGKNIINVFELSYAASISGGDSIFTNRITSDTLFYDASGSVNKIITNQIDTLAHTSETFVSYEFLSRQVRGQQLYNQRQAIMNGIANMPFGDSDSPEDAFSILAMVLDYEYLQYAKYPIQTAKISNWNGNNYNFTANSEFDNLNRLVKFTGFFLDIDLTERVYKIKYYK